MAAKKHWGGKLSRVPEARRSRFLDRLLFRCCFPTKAASTVSSSKSARLPQAVPPPALPVVSKYAPWPIT